MRGDYWLPKGEEALQFQPNINYSAISILVERPNAICVYVIWCSSKGAWACVKQMLYEYDYHLPVFDHFIEIKALLPEI